MAKLHPAGPTAYMTLQRKWLLMLLFFFSVSTFFVVLMRPAKPNSCHSRRGYGSSTDDEGENFNSSDQFQGPLTAISPVPKLENPLGFMKSKLVLLVSHELSLSGGPLLLMELAFLLRSNGAEVVWITSHKFALPEEVIHSLEIKMLNHGVQVFSSRGEEVVDTALKADLVILNTAVAGMWLDAVLKDKVSLVLPKVVWWIHEMRSHYFNQQYIKHLPSVAGVMIDSSVTAGYWKNRTREMGMKMPEPYVVHLGNSQELMEVAENSIARKVLREHVRESLGVGSDDLVVAIINSVSRGKGQGKFLGAFIRSLRLIREQKLQLPKLHAVIVGSDMKGRRRELEQELRDTIARRNLEDCVHIINKTLTVTPYLAAADVLVQNAQGTGECFGRITIEAMAFQLPVLGTAAGGTMEIIVNLSTGLLHSVGNEGVASLAKNIVELATHAEKRLLMGRKGYERVKERFLEYHMAERIAIVLKEVLNISKSQR